MTNYERIINMTKEELADELKLIANWDRREVAKANQIDKYFLDYLNKEVKGDTNRSQIRILKLPQDYLSDSTNTDHQLQCISRSAGIRGFDYVIHNGRVYDASTGEYVTEVESFNKMLKKDPIHD